MSEKVTSNRIPAATADEITTWVLPPIDNNGKVLSSAEKEARERRNALVKRQSESIQTLEIPEPPPQSGISAEEMQNIFDLAEKDGFAQGHKEGLAKGSAEGYAAGQQQGLMEMRAQLVAEQQRFQALVKALLGPFDEQQDDIEQMLLESICSLTESVIQRELSVDSSQIVTLVQAAIAALPIGAKHLRISLNPDDLAAVESYAEEQQLDWKFFVNNDLQPGGCLIETPESRVDFSVAKRLEQVLEQFLARQLADDEVVEPLSPEEPSAE
jgi:flagellar assembly protein FliH